MKARVFPLFFCLLAHAAHAKDDELHVPWDGRMPVRIGGGYSGLHDGAGLSISFEAAFIGREMFSRVHPQVVLGIDGVRGTDIPTVLPDDKGVPTSFGFPKSLVGITTGLGVFIGRTDGFAVSIVFAPGAALGSLPGKKKGDSIPTVGVGLLGRIEIIPWFLSMHRDEDDDDDRPAFGRWILSSLSFYVVTRMDWVETPISTNGAYFGGGIGVDIARLLVGPFLRRSRDRDDD